MKLSLWIASTALGLCFIGVVDAQSTTLLAPTGSAVEAAVLHELDSSPDGRAYVLVALKEPFAWSSAAPSQRRLLVRSVQQTVLDAFADGEFELAYRYRNFPAFTGWADEPGIQKLASHPWVAAVGPDAKGELRLDTSRPYLGADRVELELGITGKGATVVVADTGIDTDHPDLADSVAKGAFHFLGQGANIGPGAEDDTSSGHGTLVSGVITSNGTVAPRGIAPDADILAIKVTPNQGELMASDVNAASDYAVSVKDDYEHLVAINYSLGFYFTGISLPEPCPCDDVNAASRLSAMAVRAARDAGILTFGASGNTGSCGPNGQMGYPECVSACVAVGAIHDEDVGRVPAAGTHLSDCVAKFGAAMCQGVPDCFDPVSSPDSMVCFTDRTQCLQLFAPGCDIFSTKIGGGKTDRVSGTSVASPHAVAVAALLAGRGISPDQVLELMTSTGRRISDDCPTAPHDATIIDAFAAVSSAEASFPLSEDCNRNFVPDEKDLLAGTSRDCDANGVPDECEGGCNQNGIPDACDVESGTSADCNRNGVPDECDVVPRNFALAAPMGVTAGATIADIAAADIDGDGSADIVTATRNPNGFVAHFNAGEGVFLDQVAIATTDAPSAVILSDWNGDGFLDLAAVAAGTIAKPGATVILAASGPGRTFGEPQGVTVGSQPRAMAAADLDADGDLELAVVNEKSADVSVLRNQGSGVFAAAESHPTGARPGFLSTADWDGDGDLDLITANRGSQDLSVLLNAAGELSPVVSIELGFQPALCQTADLNRDGLADVVTGRLSFGDVMVLLRNQDGSLGEATTYEVWPGPVELAPADVVSADLNGDGAVDLVTANSRINDVSVFINDGGGRLRPAMRFDAGASPRFLAAARVKARAGLDLVVASTSRIEVLLSGAEPAESLDKDSNGIPDECEPPLRLLFHRGDPNSSGTTDISDAIATFGFLFLGDPLALACNESADSNNDGAIDVSDGIYLLSWLFTGGPAPAAPGPASAPCGFDPDEPGSAQALGCDRYTGCN